MHVFRPANWWLPGWLDRQMPHLSVELCRLGQPAVAAPGVAVRRDRQRRQLRGLQAVPHPVEHGDPRPAGVDGVVHGVPGDLVRRLQGSADHRTGRGRRQPAPTAEGRRSRLAGQGLGYVGADIVHGACARDPMTRTAVAADGKVVDPALR